MTSPVVAEEVTKLTSTLVVKGGAVTTALAWAHVVVSGRETVSVWRTVPSLWRQLTCMVTETPLGVSDLPQNPMVYSPGWASKPGQLFSVTPAPYGPVTSTRRLA